MNDYGEEGKDMACARKGSGQELLFLACLACAAILCIVVFGSVLEHLGVIKLPQWVR